jgi:SAM-dependent methyltransferase
VDSWHRIVHRQTVKALRSICPNLGASRIVIVNLGSGGASFDLVGAPHVHVDLVGKRLIGKTAVIANVEDVPLRDSSADFVLSLGSVVNHGDGERMIREIGRITKSSGIAVIEFDCADGLHQPTHSNHTASVPTCTFFNARMLQLAEHSRWFVEQELLAAGFKIEYVYSFHILSALMLRLGVPPWLAAQLAAFDPLMRRSPWKYRGSNLLIVGRKR